MSKKSKGPKKSATKKSARANRGAAKPETPAEREKRRAKLEALTLRVFQMAYEAHHQR